MPSNHAEFPGIALYRRHCARAFHRTVLFFRSIHGVPQRTIHSPQSPPLTLHRSAGRRAATGGIRVCSSRHLRSSPVALHLLPPLFSLPYNTLPLLADEIPRRPLSRFWFQFYATSLPIRRIQTPSLVAHPFARPVGCVSLQPQRCAVRHFTPLPNRHSAPPSTLNPLLQITTEYPEARKTVIESWGEGGRRSRGIIYAST